MNRTLRLCFFVALGTVIVLGTAVPVEAGRGVRSSARSNVNRNKNVNVNSNRNKNVNVNVDVDRRGGYHGGCCYNPHPIATAAAVVATAVVVGSVVNTLPTGCSTMMINGFAYQQCGNTWYQPQMSGSSTTYVVVNPPR